MNLKSLVIKAPLIQLYTDKSELANRIYLKAENLQFLGSYKIRGVVNFFEKTEPEKLCEGVAAVSAGNMGQSVAYIAQRQNIPCTVYIPDSTPDFKKNRIQQFGAQIEELPFDTLWKYVTHPPISPPDSPLFIHPVYTKLLQEGYKQIAEELIEDLPELDALVIPFGLGGLTIALSKAMRHLKPSVSIYTCEPETAAPLKAALHKRKSFKINPQPSFIDAIGTPEVLTDVYDQVVHYLKDSEVVNIHDAAQSLKQILFGNKLLCEGASACSVAAAINIAKKTNHQKIVCILTGGNITPTALQNIISP